MTTSDTRRLPATYKRFGRVSLRVIAGPDQGEVFRLDVRQHRTLSGGRSAHNDIVLRDDTVSGKHFECAVQQDGLLLRDSDSTNGLVIGGARVREAWLAPGVRFRAGHSELELLTADVVDIPVWPEDRFGDMIGRSPIMRELFALLDRISSSEGRLGRVAVLLGGPTGSGKELAARALHERSSRAAGPFVAINCSAISRELAESALFGHARGSFTGAVEARAGVFEAASGGTLFLDEVAELPLDLQAKLLRPLELQEVVRVGEHRPRAVDVRVVAATHRNLPKLVDQERFREDLFYRLNGFYVEMPPLRERGDDVLLLAQRFLDELLEGTGRQLGLSDEARAALLAEPWPGNVRQLQRAIQRAAIVADGPEILRRHLALDLGALLAGTDLERLLQQPVREASRGFERMYYRRLLQRCRTRAEAARLAGITPEGLRVAVNRLELGDAD